MDTTQLKRIADALEEILRLVKADQEKFTARESRERLQSEEDIEEEADQEKLEHINLKEKYASLEPDPND